MTRLNLTLDQTRPKKYLIELRRVKLIKLSTRHNQLFYQFERTRLDHRQDSTQSRIFPTFGFILAWHTTQPDRAMIFTQSGSTLKKIIPGLKSFIVLELFYVISEYSHRPNNCIFSIFCCFQEVLQILKEMYGLNFESIWIQLDSSPFKCPCQNPN